MRHSDAARDRRAPATAGALLAALALSGCSTLFPDESHRLLRGAAEPPITLANLEQRTRDFADRYVFLLGDACDNVKDAADTPERRQRAHLIKLRSAAS